MAAKRRREVFKRCMWGMSDFVTLAVKYDLKAK
jgi:hypothetical protein